MLWNCRAQWLFALAELQPTASGASRRTQDVRHSMQHGRRRRQRHQIRWRMLFLTTAVIDHYRPGFRRIESVDYGISAAQQTNRGLATTSAVLSYVGKPFTTMKITQTMKIQKALSRTLLNTSSPKRPITLVFSPRARGGVSGGANARPRSPSARSAPMLSMRRATNGPEPRELPQRVSGPVR